MVPTIIRTTHQLPFHEWSTYRSYASIRTDKEYRGIRVRTYNGPLNPVSSIGLVVNPMSGRDVRRLAARASTVTHEAKMDIVARVAAGADAVGIDDIYISREPFQISTKALQWMPLNARVHTLSVAIEHGPQDTRNVVEQLLKRNVHTIVSLGGDGTQRVICSVSNKMNLIPLATGTNNVFPLQVEPSIAGMAAGLFARGLFEQDQVRKRAKVIELSLPSGETDIALIDLALLEHDFVGNFAPFEVSKLRTLILTRAVPHAIGMSPIGGLLTNVDEHEDCGLLVKTGTTKSLRVPVSPGLFRDVGISEAQKLQMNVKYKIPGPGILALDGDRMYRLTEDESASVSLTRTGPYIIDVVEAMRCATNKGILLACS